MTTSQFEPGPNGRGPQSSGINIDALASLIANGQRRMPDGLPNVTAVKVLRLAREKRRQAFMKTIARLLARNQLDSA